jgi:cap1 methyltransferase
MGGSFVCKVFDLFTYSMNQILYLLYNSFEKVIIYKPETSRPANSEKYIVCINFYDNISQENKNKLIENIKIWNDIKDEENTAFLKNIKIDSDFLHKISEYNLKYIDYQMHYLKNTIKISETKMEKNEYNSLINNQVSCAINWCKKYNVKINENSIYYKKNV